MWDAAPWVECACGCGQKIKAKDEYGRDKLFANGHNNRKYESPTQYKREWNHRNRSARMKEKTARVYGYKRTLLLEHGGKCQRCGLVYNGENGSCFDFHHIPGFEKKFGLNLASMGRYGMDKLREESAKCLIMCSNCHRLEHSARY